MQPKIKRIGKTVNGVAFHAEAESKDTLGRMLRNAGIPLDSRRLELLWRYHCLIREFNEEYDLTRLRSFRDFVVKHYIDCLIIPRLTVIPSPLLDIGAGAGFPGIPLKIAVPECEIILAESRSKRNEFLRMAIERLGLNGIEVLGKGIQQGRVERKAAGVITRAVESAAETLGRVRDALDTGGKVILMKGPRGEDEIADGLRLHGGSFRLLSNTPYTLPGTAYHRRLLIFEKTLPAVTPKISETREDTVITSAANDHYKEWKSSLTGGGIRKTGHALVSGPKIISEVIRLKPEIISAWIGFASGDKSPEALSGHVPRYRLSRELFHELDVHGTNHPLLVVNVPPMRPFDISALPGGAVPFIAFQDPANVGAVIRSAAAFGARAIVLLKESANPFHPKSIRAAGTAVFLVDFMEGPSIRNVECPGLPILALAAKGKDIAAVNFPKRFALLPGIEGPGLPGEISPAIQIRIPMEPDIESLNAATAASIALYEWRKRLTNEASRE